MCICNPKSFFPDTLLHGCSNAQCQVRCQSHLYSCCIEAEAVASRILRMLTTLYGPEQMWAKCRSFIDCIDQLSWAMPGFFYTLHSTIAVCSKKLFFFKHVVLQTKYGVFACLILVGLGGRGVHNFCKVTLYVIIHVTFRIGIGIHPLKYRDPILWNWDIVFEIHIIFPNSKKWDFLWHFHFGFQG